ncbi:Metallo-beta-lactamase domain-containing protein [Entamoeba marina]
MLSLNTPSDSTKEIINKNYNDWTIKHIQINVGHGDSSLVLIKHKEDIIKSILIDCGLESSNHNIMNTLRFNGVKQLDAIIITHWHQDHCGGYQLIGLRDILNNQCQEGKTHFFAPSYYPEYMKSNNNVLSYLNGIIHSKNQHFGFNNIFNNFKLDQIQPVSVLDDFIGRNGLNLTIPNEIDMKLLSVDGCCIGANTNVLVEHEQLLKQQIIHNDTKYLPVIHTLNQTSIGLLIECFKSTILTCGDLEKSCSECIKNYLNDNHSKINIVKLNHHGWFDNCFTDDRFVFPDYDIALISFGKTTNFQLPDHNTLKELFNKEKPILCTDIPSCLFNDNATTFDISKDELSKVKKHLICAKENVNFESLLSGNGNIKIECQMAIYGNDYESSDITILKGRQYINIIQNL